MVDPEIPSVTVLGSPVGEFTAVAGAEGDDELSVETPFPLRLRPTDLTR